MERDNNCLDIWHGEPKLTKFRSNNFQLEQSDVVFTNKIHMYKFQLIYFFVKCRILNNMDTECKIFREHIKDKYGDYVHQTAN